MVLLGGPGWRVHSARFNQKILANKKIHRAMIHGRWINIGASLVCWQAKYGATSIGPDMPGKSPNSIAGQNREVLPASLGMTYLSPFAKCDILLGEKDQDALGSSGASAAKAKSAWSTPGRRMT